MMKLNELNSTEQRIFDLIQKNETAEVISLFDCGNARVNCLDSSGLTPLDQACFKANKQLVGYLLEHGSDPNSNQHAQGYTSLMFAALGAQPGAHAYTTNSIDKTAAQMAAFVGQHECVSIINNYVGLEDVERLVHPKGKDSDEIFPAEFCRLVHATTRTHRIHPVKIIFFIHDNESVLKYRKKFLYVVDRLFESQLRCKESNEVMSLKLWLILFVLREALKFVDSSGKGTVAHRLHTYAKYLLKMEPGEKIRPNLETLLRNAVRAFPYHQSLLFQTLVKAISQIKFGERPDSFMCISQALFGQRAAIDAHFCAVCGVTGSKKRCKSCKLPYCSVECQKLDWSVHKRCCASMVDVLRQEALNPPIQYIHHTLPVDGGGDTSVEGYDDVTRVEDIDVSSLSVDDRAAK